MLSATLKDQVNRVVTIEPTTAPDNLLTLTSQIHFDALSHVAHFSKTSVFFNKSAVRTTYNVDWYNLKE